MVKKLILIKSNSLFKVMGGAIKLCRLVLCFLQPISKCDLPFHITNSFEKHLDQDIDSPFSVSRE